MAVSTEELEEFRLEQLLQEKFEDGRQRFHLAMNMIKQDFRPSSRTVLAQNQDTKSSSDTSNKSRAKAPQIQLSEIQADPRLQDSCFGGMIGDSMLPDRELFDATNPEIAPRNPSKSN